MKNYTIYHALDIIGPIYFPNYSLWWNNARVEYGIIAKMVGLVVHKNEG